MARAFAVMLVAGLILSAGLASGMVEEATAVAADEVTEMDGLLAGMKAAKAESGALSKQIRKLRAQLMKTDETAKPIMEAIQENKAKQKEANAALEALLMKDAAYADASGMVAALRTEVGQLKRKRTEEEKAAYAAKRKELGAAIRAQRKIRGALLKENAEYQAANVQLAEVKKAGAALQAKLTEQLAANSPELTALLDQQKELNQKIADLNKQIRELKKAAAKAAAEEKRAAKKAAKEAAKKAGADK